MTNKQAAIKLEKVVNSLNKKSNEFELLSVVVSLLNRGKPDQALAFVMPLSDDVKELVPEQVLKHIKYIF